ncbi:MAG: FliH/SctL family protein [Rariglobus sp.]
MPSFTRLVPFDRSLSGAAIAGQTRALDEREVAAIREQAYREGADSARAFADQQMVDLRHGLQQLQEGLFGRLAGAEDAIVTQLQNALPALAIDLARRLLAGYEPPVEVVQTHCREVLEALYPERENLELIISPRDAALLEKLNSSWAAQYPGLRITADESMSPGDCQVRSRFGITDARISAKLEALERELLAS